MKDEHGHGAKATAGAGSQHANKSKTQPHQLVLGALIPILALTLSIISFFVSRTSEQDVGRIEAVKTEYALFHELAQLQLDHPQMAHLFAETAESYDANVKAIRRATSYLPKEDRAKMLLQERAMAHYVFTSYEETFYLWRESTEGERGRSHFLQDDMEYFNALLCSNPRLLWYWDMKSGGKLGQAFAGDLQVYYDAKVAKECPTEKDAQGPYSNNERTTQ